MFKKGDRVRHPIKSEWGIGEVLEDQQGDVVRIYFGRLWDEKSLNLQYVNLDRVKGEEADDPLLRSFVLPSGKDAKSQLGMRSLPQAIERFLTDYPGGFDNQVYQSDEREYKDAAVKVMSEVLSDAALGRLREAGDFDEIVSRGKRMLSKTNMVFPNEIMALNDGLKDPDNRRLFADALYRLLVGDESEQIRFERFADCLETLGAAKWTIASYYQCLRWPESRLFIKPTIVQQFARMSNQEIAYRPELNWKTYAAVQDMAFNIMAGIQEDLAPRDMIDVQGFMYCAVTGR